MFLNAIEDSWLFPENFQHATSIQKQLKDRVILQDELGTSDIIAGIDASCSPYDPEHKVYACCALLCKKTFRLLERFGAIQTEALPYRSGFLGFREVPAIISCLKSVKEAPGIVFVDGHGIAHPRGLGIASHLGVLTGLATIGVAKSLLCGRLEKPLGSMVGDQVGVIWKGEVIGMALRSKVRCLPLIISPGHKVSFKTAVDLVLEQLKGYRLPEATRQAHLAASLFRKDQNAFSARAVALQTELE